MEQDWSAQLNMKRTGDEKRKSCWSWFTTSPRALHVHPSLT